MENEAENNLLLGILNNLQKNIQTYSKTENPFLVAVFSDSTIKLISVRTPPFKQIISYTEDLNTIHFLIEALLNKKMNIPGILGFKKGALEFTRLWTKKNGMKYELEMNERFYRLEQVRSNTLGSNDFGILTPKERELIYKWNKAFILEALPESSSEEIKISQKRIEQSIKRNLVYVLREKGKIVSIAKRAGCTPHGQRINAVYTPPELRGKGYATEVVAKLSQTILDEGKKFCFLSTDLANPISNKIYQEIGYKPVIDIDVYNFKM